MNKRQRKKKKTLTQQARTRVLFDTGTRVHAPAKGKGSYRRKKAPDGGEEGA